jgi:lipopolysaccharide heptosyltransferase II
MKILLKLPNKLGDTIMASSFVKVLKSRFPEAQIDAIMASAFSDLQYFFPEINKVYGFSKKEYSGPFGSIKFGKHIRSLEKYDLFFCLPFSFSSALTGYFTHANRRVGHKTEHRGFLLTDKYLLPPGLHVVEDYVNLLDQFFGERIDFAPPKFTFQTRVDFDVPNEDYIVLNLHSGPPSRIVPVDKAVAIIHDIRKRFPHQIVLTSAPSEVKFIDLVVSQLESTERLINLAGKTGIVELGWVLKNASIVVSTDTGNAHFANALNTPTVVLFGPGIQHRCHPYQKDILRSLQLLDMPCISCNRELCKFGDNRCLTNIPNASILRAMQELVNQNFNSAS